MLEANPHEIFDMLGQKVSIYGLHLCKYPQKFRKICHIDNTSRVQTVSKEDNRWLL